MNKESAVLTESNSDAPEGRKKKKVDKAAMCVRIFCIKTPPRYTEFLIVKYFGLNLI